MEKNSINAITWCSPHANHYNSYMFEHFQESLEQPFFVVYFDKKLTKYPWKSDFSNELNPKYLNTLLLIDWLFIIKQFTKKRNLLVVAGWNNLTMVMLISLYALFNKPFLLVSDTPPTADRIGFKQNIRKRWLSWVFKKVKFMLATGKPAIKNFIKLKFDEERLINFPFATNNDFFSPLATKDENSLEENVRIISSGRLDNAHKGYDIAFEALKIFKDRHPDKKFTYSIAGTGPDKGIIVKDIKSHGLYDHVKLIGWLEPKDLLSFYRSADLFLHPSRFDPFPNAVLEAMSCGLPVIGSDQAGSVLDRVIETENGYVHKSEDALDLAGKLELFFSLENEQLKDMKSSSREVALNWTVEYNIDTFKKVVDSI